MLYLVEGNIFETPAQTLVNTVNTAGAMGKGLAQEFKRLFPDMFKKYQQLCESQNLTIGRLWLYQTPHKWVLNFPTKEHWRQPSRLEYIEAGLRTFTQIYEQARISTVAFPQLGCGNGELDWRDVKPLMMEHLKGLPIDVYVYEVSHPGIPEHRDIQQMRKWLQSEPGAYPFDEFAHDLRKLLTGQSLFEDTHGQSFEVYVTDDAVTIKQGSEERTVPWVGNDSGTGWLELWQFMRDKRMVTEDQLATMGVGLTAAVVTLLLKMPYVRSLVVRNGNRNVAARLYPGTNSPGLFHNSSSESIRL